MTDQKDQDQKLDSIKLRVEKEKAEREAAGLPSSLSSNSYSSSQPIKDPEDTLADPHAPEHEWLEAAHELNKEEEKNDRKRDREQDKALKKTSEFERKFLIAFFTAIAILCGIAFFSGALLPHQPDPQHVSTPIAPHDQATRDIDFSPYLNAIQKAIKSNWHPPKGDKSHVVRVKFKIHKNGEISDLAFDRMSRSPENDAAAIKAIIASMPALPPLPEGSPDSVDMVFTFEYKVFEGPSQTQTAPQP